MRNKGCQRNDLSFYELDLLNNDQFEFYRFIGLTIGRTNGLTYPARK